MVKFSKNFFQDKEVLFVGYSSRNKAYSNGILQGFSNNDIKVYPYNTKENAAFDTKVYKNFDELPVMPKSAFVLLNKSNSDKVVKELIDKGVKKILFYSKIEPQLQLECDKAGVEIAFGCPLMAYGKGMHKIHAFFAGVK